MHTNLTPTPHNRAKCGDFAQKVLMPGDPLRAKFIAETYLEEPVLVTDVRNVYGYTGRWKGEPVSVMAHGMGMPSLGIYVHELFHFYDVEEIIRVGSAGSISPGCDLMDIVLAEGACTNSNYQDMYHLYGHFAPIASFDLLRCAAELAEESGIAYQVGNVLSHDQFYYDHPEDNEAWKAMGCLAVEMEVAALYMEAARAGKRALGILTISDNLLTGAHLSADDRERGFGQMIELALSL